MNTLFAAIASVLVAATALLGAVKVYRDGKKAKDEQPLQTYKELAEELREQRRVDNERADRRLKEASEDYDRRRLVEQAEFERRRQEDKAQYEKQLAEIKERVEAEAERIRLNELEVHDLRQDVEKYKATIRRLWARIEYLMDLLKEHAPHVVIKPMEDIEEYGG